MTTEGRFLFFHPSTFYELLWACVSTRAPSITPFQISLFFWLRQQCSSPRAERTRCAVSLSVCQLPVWTRCINSVIWQPIRALAATSEGLMCLLCWEQAALAISVADIQRWSWIFLCLEVISLIFKGKSGFLTDGWFCFTQLFTLQKTTNCSRQAHDSRTATTSSNPYWFLFSPFLHYKHKCSATHLF